MKSLKTGLFNLKDIQQTQLTNNTCLTVKGLHSH